MLQYPLHIYMIRITGWNEHLLNGDSENYWDSVRLLLWRCWRHQSFKDLELYWVGLLILCNFY